MLIYRTMGILSSSKIFTKHGDKMIFKSTMLSPLKNMAMGTLSPSELFTKHGDKMIFKITMLSPLQKTGNGDLVSIKNIYKAWRQDDFQNYYVVPIKSNIYTTQLVCPKHAQQLIYKYF